MNYLKIINFEGRFKCDYCGQEAGGDIAEFVITRAKYHEASDCMCGKYRNTRMLKNLKFFYKWGYYSSKYEVKDGYQKRNLEFLKEQYQKMPKRTTPSPFLDKFRANAYQVMLYLDGLKDLKTLELISCELEYINRKLEKTNDWFN